MHNYLSDMISDVNEIGAGLSNIHPKCLDDERGILPRSYRSNP